MGCEVLRNGLFVDIGVMMFNVGICFVIVDVILYGKLFIECIVIVIGEVVEFFSNFRVLIGMLVLYLLDEVKYNLKK